ncbi:hypothetical protein [Neobacillus jeddahensis]|uniref:hypothetical protein n=1 Tax=Neobacillus jeddahensis TaxID=1461580 RepID=UPI000694C2E1|nr:hypothetical protein [Neobacillus jeddahensis]
MATLHGLSNTRLHSLWRKMKDRCNNQRASNYCNYGGRGITICNSWNEDFMSFYQWAIANDYNDRLSIERVSVNGNYEPSNCKWIKPREQSRNKRDTQYTEINGVTKTLIEWAEIYDIPYKTIMTRWYRGWRGIALVQPSKKPRKVS